METIYIDTLFFIHFITDYFILLCAGALADKQHLGIRHALAKHHMAALGTKGASAALQAIGLQLGNIHNKHSPKII